jgi:catechol 2,3-dioxygenase-like lactoylglutathione lyase family enzyme
LSGSAKKCTTPRAFLSSSARSARTSNGVTLDYADATEFRRQHYAFLVSEPEFDAALSRIKHAGIAFYADFSRAGHDEINHLYGGRGFYFDDPDGHLLEIITRPYGPSPERWMPSDKM